MNASPLEYTSRPRLLLAYLIVLGSALQFGQTVIQKLTESPLDSANAPELQVDPNTVPVEVLLALPRLGPTLAERIKQERETQPFRSMDDLDERVPGIGPATRKALEPFFKFSTAPTP